MCIMTHVAHTAFLLDSDARCRKGPREETALVMRAQGLRCECSRDILSGMSYISGPPRPLLTALQLGLKMKSECP